MTVFVVMEAHLKVHRVNGIFTSKESAEKHIEDLKIKSKKYIDTVYLYYDWWIEKHTVIGE